MFRKSPCNLVDKGILRRKLRPQPRLGFDVDVADQYGDFDPEPPKRSMQRDPEDNARVSVVPDNGSEVDGRQVNLLSRFIQGFPCPSEVYLKVKLYARWESIFVGNFSTSLIQNGRSPGSTDSTVIVSTNGGLLSTRFSLIDSCMISVATLLNSSGYSRQI